MNSACPNRECRKCGLTGHLSDTCDVIRCTTCQSMGHRAGWCPTTTSCRKCGKIGHLKAACPDRVCPMCGEKGHSKDQCGPARYVSDGITRVPLHMRLTATAATGQAGERSEHLKARFSVFSNANPLVDSSLRAGQGAKWAKAPDLDTQPSPADASPVNGTSGGGDSGGDNGGGDNPEWDDGGGGSGWADGGGGSSWD